MTQARTVSEHWATGDVFGRIMDAIKAAGIKAEGVTVEQLAPVDHFHARGFPATKDLADVLPIKPGYRILDIGCGLGGPARYFAERFECRVEDIDITEPSVEAANKLTKLVGLEDRVSVRQGDGQHLPYEEESFDGAYTQHVLMNVADRESFFAEAWRVLKPNGFFALTEHGLGDVGNPRHPVPWSDDGTGEHLMRPKETIKMLESTGFVRIAATETGEKYLEGYRKAIDLAERGELPSFGVHLLLGGAASEKTKNAARNIEERRTRPLQIVCHKPA